MAGALSTALLAVPLTMAAGYVVAAREHLHEQRRVLGAARETVLRDGERVVVRGPITPLREPLKSPFTGHDCVAYRYVVDARKKNLDGPPSRIRDYWGLALCPCAIETPAGPVRILGWPVPGDAGGRDAGQVSERTPTSAPPRSAIREPTPNGWVPSPRLRRPSRTSSVTTRAPIGATTAPPGIGKCRTSRAVTSASGVSRWVRSCCATGTYSAALQALLPGGSGSSRLRLSTFTPELWASENRDSAYTYLRWGAVFAVVAVASALATRWC